MPTRPELERFFFFLDDDDRDLIVLRRSDGHRLGMAVQIGTVRYIGTLSRVPVNRLNTLARQGQLSKAQTIERAPEPRKTALLTAVVRNLEAQAVDDALDLFVLLMATRLISPARRVSDKQRLAVLPQLEKAARILAKASKILAEELDLVAEHDADLDVAALWAAVEEAVPREAVSGSVAWVEALVPKDDESAEAAMREKLALRYNTVRPFVSLLDESNALGAAQGGKRILKAVRRLPALSRRRVKEHVTPRASRQEAPTSRKAGRTLRVEVPLTNGEPIGMWLNAILRPCPPWLWAVLR